MANKYSDGSGKITSAPQEKDKSPRTDDFKNQVKKVARALNKDPENPETRSTLAHFFESMINNKILDINIIGEDKNKPLSPTWSIRIHPYAEESKTTRSIRIVPYDPKEPAVPKEDSIGKVDNEIKCPHCGK